MQRPEKVNVLCQFLDDERNFKKLRFFNGYIHFLYRQLGNSIYERGRICEVKSVAMGITPKNRDIRVPRRYLQYHISVRRDLIFLLFSDMDSEYIIQWFGNMRICMIDLIQSVPNQVIAISIKALWFFISSASSYSNSTGSTLTRFLLLFYLID